MNLKYLKLYENFENNSFIDYYKEMGYNTESVEEIPENVKNKTIYLLPFNFILVVDLIPNPVGKMVRLSKRSKKGYVLKYNYRFPTDDRLVEYANRYIENFKKELERKEEIKKKKKDVQHNFKVGDILYDSWGYEQTNIDFYQIVRTTKKSVWLRPIAKEHGRATGPFSGKVKPIKDEFIGDPIRKTVKHIIKTDGTTNSYIKSKFGAFSKYTGEDGIEASWGH